ncbi:MAG: MBL fold metallo-hydrolase [Candidatus Aenigmatarchaeota archaeon]|nr:MAG: MBL fold metallo-hydrolase [Candidatus Aenigmarchaeota archaeon]
MKKLFIILILFILISGCVQEVGDVPLQTGGDEPYEGLRVNFIAVHGDSILIESPEGQKVLIDGGSEAHAHNYLKSKNITVIDHAIATHPHSDHMPGIEWIMSDEDFRLKKLYGNKGAEAHLSSRMAKIGLVNVQVLKAGDSIDIGGAKLDVLWPPPDTGAIPIFSNDLSLVTRLEYGNVSFLFMGDCEAFCEYGIISSEAEIDSTILKAGHHGLETSSKPEFLQAVSPDVIVTTSYSSSQYEPPVYIENRDINEYVMNTDSSHFDTQWNGTIRITTDGNAYNISLEKAPRGERW